MDFPSTSAIAPQTLSKLVEHYISETSRNRHLEDIVQKLYMQIRTISGRFDQAISTNEQLRAALHRQIIRNLKLIQSPLSPDPAKENEIRTLKEKLSKVEAESSRKSENESELAKKCDQLNDSVAILKKKISDSLVTIERERQENSRTEMDSRSEIEELNRKLLAAKTEHSSLQSKIEQQSSEISRLMNECNQPSSTGKNAYPSKTDPPPTIPQESETHVSPPATMMTATVRPHIVPCVFVSPSSNSNPCPQQNNFPAPNRHWLNRWNFACRNVEEVLADSQMRQAVMDYLKWHLEDYFDIYGSEGLPDTLPLRDDIKNFTRFFQHCQRPKSSDSSLNFHFKNFIRKVQNFLNLKLQRIEATYGRKVPLMDETVFMLNLTI